MKRLSQFAQGVVIYNLLVILFGAWVRITGSGAGCGEHWPTCNGEVIPRAMPVARVIEFTHRLTSGLSLILVLALLVWTLMATQKGHAARKSAVAMGAFIVLEALIGAGLVIFGLVDKNSSAARAIVIAFHLVNTLGLLASGALTAHFLAGERKKNVEVSERGWLIAALLAVAVVAATGAITALGDTLLPAQTIAEDHFLIRLRIVHPVFAVCTAVLLTVVSRIVRTRSHAPDTQRYAKILLAFTHTQVLLGVANILLEAPGWMQLVHLLMANLVWIALVLTSASRFRPLALLCLFFFVACQGDAPPPQLHFDASESEEVALSASTPAATYKWTQVSPSNPKGVFANAGSQSTTWTAPIVCSDTVFMLRVTAVNATNEQVTQDVEVAVADSTAAAAPAPSLTLAKTDLVAGEEVRLSVDARGPGCTTTVAWTATGGSFDDPSAASTTWHSDLLSEPAAYDLKVKVGEQEASTRVSVHVPSYAEVQEVFDDRHARCAFCHTPGNSQNGGFDLAKLSSSTNASKTNCGSGKMLLPGDPDKSIFVKRLRRDGCSPGTGARMPYDELTYFEDHPGDRIRIESWVKAGANF